MIAASILSLFTSGSNSVQPNESQQAAAPATSSASPLTLADLWQPCSECNGTGEPKPQTNTKKPEGLLDPALLSNHFASLPYCRACDGHRGKPTPAGQAVLALLEKVQEKPYRNPWTHQNLRGA